MRAQINSGASFDRMLSPQSIAIIGASNRMPGIGGFVTANVKRAFRGAIYPVNPREAEVQGLPAVAAVEDLPAGIDLAIVIVPAVVVPATLEACAARGVAGVVLITSGFAEVGAEGAALQAEVVEIVARTGLRIIGPNCIGFMNLAAGVMANFVLDPTDALPPGGPVALVSQSGGFGGYMVRKALTAGLNVGWFISTGNEVDVNISAVLRHMVEREDVRVLLAFSETLRDPELFIETARRACELDKPLVILKAGRSEAAARAAQAHTGSLVGSAEAFDAVCRQYNVFSATTLEEMLDLGLIFQGGRRTRGNRVGIITGSGGAGVMLSDACVLEGLSVPELPDDDQGKLLAHMPQPFMGSVANPVDVTAQAMAAVGAMDAVLNGVPASDAVDMVAPVIIGNPTHPDMYIDAYRNTDKPVAYVSTLLPTSLLDAGVPAYTDPRRAAHALAATWRYSSRTRLDRVSATVPVDADRLADARRILARAGERRALMEADAKQLLALYGAPVTRESLCASADEAVAAAAAIGGAAALKIMSPDLLHKSDFGGVRLNISGEADIRREYAALLDDVGRHAPRAVIAGVLVQEMMPTRIEMLCGMQRDPLFGPMIVIGIGGVMVEILAEAALLRAPFDQRQALEAIDTLCGGRLRTATRGLSQPEAEAVARVAMAVGNAALELDEIAEIDLNPVIVSGGRAIAVDALVVLS